MSLIDWANIYRFNLFCLAEHGEGNTRSLGWRDDHSQLSRFAMLVGIGDMNGCSVLDVGCGHGDLRVYLDDKYPDINYTGIDQMEDFLTIAVKRYDDLPRTNFLYGDFCTVDLPKSDYVLASGSLNYYNNDPEFIYKIIAKLFNTCKIALGFNLLGDIAPNGLLVAYDVDAITNYCRMLSSKVIVHQGYSDDDFTVWMYR
ncbi:class I SAM-dependent methyltransferase [Mucilaginibacter sp. AW1-3]